MRIVICMPFFCPWSRSIAKSLQAMGNDVFVFDFQRRSERGLVSGRIDGIREDAEEFEKRISGVKIVPTVLKDRLQYLLRAPELGRYARSIGADIILSLSGAGYVMMAYLSRFRPFAPYMVGSDILLAGRLARRLNCRMLHAASVVFVNGDYLASKAIEQAPWANLVPLLIGIDLGTFSLADLGARPTQVICTRGFEDVYNNEAIIHALARLSDTAPLFRVVFVSGGELLPGCVELADRILPATVRQRVVFLRGVSNSRLLAELHRSHVLVSMSKSDGTATSLLEGLACGLYPVLSDIPQNREWIFPDKNNGVLVPLDDSDALASALTRAVKTVGDSSSHGYVAFNRRLVESRADASRNRAVLLGHLKRATET